ncbi:hypothetical protein KBZ21_41820, partial [Streptomyces sp. A73]|nr:hypothetical protein [Streptomyces sp. A73]
ISHRYLSHLETGSRRRMSPTRYVALRTALHATDEELLSTEEPFPPRGGHSDLCAYASGMGSRCTCSAEGGAR